MLRKLLKPSTRSFYNEARKSADFSFLGLVHGYLYGRFPYLYIGVGTGGHPLARMVLPIWRFFRKFSDPRSRGVGRKIKDEFADSYHGKVLPLEQARKLVTVNRDIELGDLKRVVPYSKARNLILRSPDHIVVLECPCRTSRTAPCLPLEVCLVVGEPFARFIAEHHPNRSRWINQDEAVDILTAESKRGHVHHAFFKDAMLDRFYAICNCCSCCCGAMQAWDNGIPMLASSGFLRYLDPELCTGCGICAEACQFGAVEMIEGKPVLNADSCMGCGVCVRQCRQKALSLVQASGKGEPLDLDELINRATN
ncbi:MAG: ATP-binding protein [Desulfurivibrionaceae bacterium]